MTLQGKVHWARSLRAAKHRVAKLRLSLEEAQRQTQEVQLLYLLHDIPFPATYTHVLFYSFVLQHYFNPSSINLKATALVHFIS